MNKIILTGNLTKAPELKYTQSGKAYLRVSIAVSRKKDETEFFELVAWEKTAEFISKYFVKGSRIIVEGRLQNNNYTDAKGIKHYGVDVIVENVEFGGGKRNEQAEKSKGDAFADDFVEEELPEDSMPF